MGYYKAEIIRPMFDGNYTQGKKTKVYFALDGIMTDSLLKELNWKILMIYSIPAYQYAWQIIKNPITDHDTCFNHAESVVIE